MHVHNAGEYVPSFCHRDGTVLTEAEYSRFLGDLSETAEMRFDLDYGIITSMQQNFLYEILADAGYDPEAYNSTVASMTAATAARVEEVLEHLKKTSTEMPLTDALRSLREQGVGADALPKAFILIASRLRNAAGQLLLEFTGVSQTTRKPDWEMYNFATQEQPSGLYDFLQAQKLLEDTQVILDYGCGKGRDVLAYSRQGKKAYGVDLDKAMADAARKSTSGTDAVIVSEELDAVLSAHPEMAGAVDLITANSSLQYLPTEELRRTLATFKTLLREGGKLAIGQRFVDMKKWLAQPDDPNDVVLDVREDEICILRAVDGRARWYRTPAALARYLREAGFEIVQESTVPLIHRSDTAEEHYFCCSSVRQ